MLRVCLLFICLGIVFTLQAQTYNFSGGLRIGTEYGFSLKYRIADKVTLEGIVQSPINRNEAITTLLIEKHNSILTKGFNIYFGGGLQKGWILDEQVIDDDPFGVVGVFGAEFNISRLNLSYDVKPAVNIIGGSTNRVRLQTGISIRYIFDKRQVLFDKKKQKVKKKAKKKKQKEKLKRYKQKLKDKYERKNQSKPKNGLNIDKF